MANAIGTGFDTSRDQVLLKTGKKKKKTWDAERKRRRREKGK